MHKEEFWNVYGQRSFDLISKTGQVSQFQSMSPRKQEKKLMVRFS